MNHDTNSCLKSPAPTPLTRVPVQIVTGQLSLLINSGKEVPPVWRVYGSLWRALLLDAGVVARHRTRAHA